MFLNRRCIDNKWIIENGITVIGVGVDEFTIGSMTPMFAPRIVFGTPLTDDEETRNTLGLVIDTTVEESGGWQQQRRHSIVGPTVERS